MAVPDMRYLTKDPEWVRLMTKLRENKDVLIFDFNARFPTERLYPVGAVPAEDITDLIASTMEMYLRLLSGHEIGPDLQDLPVDLGRWRARQGVPADLLLQGVRTNSRVIWNALRNVAGPNDADALLRNTDAVLSLVEWHVSEVQSSYLREEERLARDTERQQRRLLLRLFTADSLERDEVVTIAHGLGISSDGTYEVLVLPGLREDDRYQLPESRRPSHFHEMVGGLCLFRSEGEFPYSEEMKGRSGGLVRNVRGLRLVPQAARAAIGIAGLHLHAATGGPATILDAWPTVAWRSVTSMLPAAMMPIDLARLQALPPSENERLVETAEVYFACGSIKETAERLFCHRNTVVKRLQRIEEVLSVDLSVPVQCALAILALSD